jgi:hypothetical protein
MKERRQYERLTIPIPVRLETITLSKKEVLDLETRNISASGTFIPTLTSFPERTQFILDFTILTDIIKIYNNVSMLKSCTGSMVRSTPHGLAIQFDKECQIESLKAL